MYYLPSFTYLEVSMTSKTDEECHNGCQGGEHKGGCVCQGTRVTLSHNTFLTCGAGTWVSSTPSILIIVKLFYFMGMEFHGLVAMDMFMDT